MSQIPPPLPTPAPAKKQAGPVAIVVAIGFLAMLITAGLNSQSDSAPERATATPLVPARAAPVAVPPAPAPSAPTVAVSSSRKAITHNTFGCVSAETFRDASSYWANDERALMAQLLDAGQCELLRRGDAVILVDVAFMRHIVVRRPGEATKLVTFLSAVD